MIMKLSLRYAFPSKPSLRSRSIRIVMAVSVSLAVVIVVISIMNFLQDSRFKDIRDVRSFDVVIDGDYKEELTQLLPSTSSVFIYGEGEALTQNGSFLVRYIDSSYSGGLHYYYGDSSSLVIPFSLYIESGGNEIALSMLKKGNRVTALKTISYIPSGVYYTNLGSEFDETMLFLPLKEADENVRIKTAIKGIDNKTLKLLYEKGYEITTWKEREESLYGAFLIEKTLMYVVLSLLFIIIAVSTKSSVALFFLSRRKELAELTILGLEKKKVDRVAYLSFLIVIFVGVFSSLLLGYAINLILESYSLNSPNMMTLELSLPVGGYLFFSLFLVFFTLIFVFMENRKREKTELIEVIHEW